MSALADIFISFMALTKEQKKKIIDDLEEKLAQQKTMVFVNFGGLKVNDILDLKKKLRKVNSLFKVSKKTLLKIALKDFNSSLVKKIEELEGELGIIFGFGDEILPAKIAYNFSLDKENFKILGGFFEEKFIEKEKVIELGQIPTKEELLTKLINSVSAPISNLISVFKGNIKGLICALGAIK